MREVREMKDRNRKAVMDGQKAGEGRLHSLESGPQCCLDRCPERCRRCQRALTADETAMTKKLINRGTSVYYCTDCLAEMFDVERKDIEEKIAYYKRTGCTLFR